MLEITKFFSGSFEAGSRFQNLMITLLYMDFMKDIVYTIEFYIVKKNTRVIEQSSDPSKLKNIQKKNVFYKTSNNVDI